MATIVIGTNGYCTVANVQAKFGSRTFSDIPKTHPSSTEVEEEITKGFHRINASLNAAGYVTPVDTANAPKALEVLREINVTKAVGEAHLIAFTAGVGGVPEVSAEMTRRFEAEVRRIVKGEITLEDAEKTTGARKTDAEREPEGKFRVDTDGVEKDPVLTRDMEF